VYGLRTLIPVLLLVTVVAGALAMWSDTLKINATIETGEVKVKFSEWYCNDVGADPQYDGFHNVEGKDVASCCVEVEVEDEEGNPIKLLVTLDNTYPGYYVVITFTVDNIGTIPVKLLSYEFSGVNEEALYVWLLVPEDTQIDPGDYGTYELHIVVLQGAAENSTYEFELTLTFAQWNEVH